MDLRWTVGSTCFKWMVLVSHLVSDEIHGLLMVVGPSWTRLILQLHVDDRDLEHSVELQEASIEWRRDASSSRILPF